MLSFLLSWKSSYLRSNKGECASLLQATLVKTPGLDLKGNRQQRAHLEAGPCEESSRCAARKAQHVSIEAAHLEFSGDCEDPL